MFAKALVRNHTPISKHVNLAGESLDTIDKPIGDIHSSPRVKNAYAHTSQSGLIVLALLSNVFEAKTRTIKPTESKSNPAAILRD